MAPLSFSSSPAFRKFALLSVALCLTPLTFAADLQPAITAFNEAHYSKAKPLFEAATKDAATKNDALYYLGRIAFEARDADKAKDYLEQSVGLDPNSSDEYYWLGAVYGEFAKKNRSNIFKGPSYASNSHKYLQLSIDVNPKNIEAYRGLFWFYIGAPTIVGGGIDKAEKLLSDIRAISPLDADILQLSLYKEKGEKDKQLAQAQVLMVTYPNSVEALYAAALEFFSQKKLEPAIAAFDAVSKLPKTTQNASLVENSILYFAGTCAWAGVRIDEAITRAESFLASKADDKKFDKNVGYWTLAKLYHIKGNMEKYHSLRNSLDPDFIKRTQWMRDDIDGFDKLDKKS